MKQNKEQILMIVSRFPYPLDKGDKLRAYYQLRELSSTFNITLVALTDIPVPQKDIEMVEVYCEKLEIIKLTQFSKMSQMLLCSFTNKPFQIGYFYSRSAKKHLNQLVKSNNYKHIYSQLVRTSEYVKSIHDIPKTLDYMDTLSAGIKRRIKLQPFYKKWLFKIEAKRLANYEREIFDYFENKTIISEQDKLLIQHPDSKKIICIPNGIDNSFFEFPIINQDVDLVFVGNMSYPPNIEAINYINSRLLPNLKDVKLLISGASPAKSIQQTASENKNIELLGWIDDIRISYARGKIFVAPMFIGTGMQNKLLEAMAIGLPCITTPLANNAIKATHGKNILVAETQEEFLQHIEELLANEGLRSFIGKNAQQFIKENYSWERSTQLLSELIYSAGHFDSAHFDSAQ